MNRNYALALCIACSFAGTAYADDITIDPHPFVPTATRAEVQQELRAFRASGVNPWADDYDQLAQMHGTLTRADVMADFAAARKVAAALSGEDSGSAYLMQVAAMPRQPATAFAAAPAGTQVARQE